MKIRRYRPWASGIQVLEMVLIYNWSISHPFRRGFRKNVLGTYSWKHSISFCQSIKCTTSVKVGAKDAYCYPVTSLCLQISFSSRAIFDVYVLRYPHFLESCIPTPPRDISIASQKIFIQPIVLILWGHKRQKLQIVREYNRIQLPLLERS